jgi:hypothetical protein
MPAPYYLIIKLLIPTILPTKSFVCRTTGERYFIYPPNIYARVPQGSDLSPDLYNVFTADIPQSSNTLLTAYSDDIAILSSSPNPILASAELQDHANKIEEWAKKWKIKINTEKSVQVTFTLKHSPC